MKNQPFKLSMVTISITLSALLSASPLMAAQSSQASLWESCKPTISAERSVVIPEQCMQALNDFVGGFIQIGEASDNIGTKQVQDTTSSSSSFQERVYQTRPGAYSRASSNDVGGVARSQEFCELLSAERENLQAEITERLHSAGQSNEIIDSIIAKTLRQELSC